MAHLIAILLTFAQIVAVIGLVVLVWSIVVRTRRAALLWLLSIITRRKLPLGLELEGLGDAMSGADRWRVTAAAARVRAGASLAEALSASPGLVPDDAVLIAHVGERSGRLGEAFAAEAERLARAREAAVLTTTSPTLAMIYLVAVPIALPVILTGFMIFIVPKFMKIFDDFGAQMPWVSELLIESSDQFAQYWYFAAATIVSGVTMALVLWILGRAYAWDVRLPRILTPGGSDRRSALALRALAIPAKVGRPLTDALDPMANAAMNASDRWKFDQLRTRYRSGMSLWDAMVSERLISRRDARLFAAAEQAGNLAWALNLVADRIDDHRRRRFAAFVEVAQPVVVLLLGAIVLFVCIGIFMPLIQLINDLS